MASQWSDELLYVKSHSLRSKVRVKLCTLEGSGLDSIKYEHILNEPMLKYSGRQQSKRPDLRVEAVLGMRDCVKGELVDMHEPVFAAYKHFSRRWEWNEWLRFPVSYSDLPRDAVLTLSLFDCDGPDKRHCVGKADINLFDNSGLLRQGQVDLRVRRSSSPLSPSDSSSKLAKLCELSRLSQKYRSGKLSSVDWLDRVAVAEVEKLQQKEKQLSNLLFLTIDFQAFKIAQKQVEVVFFEADAQEPNTILSAIRPDIIRCPDFDIGAENLVEAKHYRLIRSRLANPLEIRPNVETRKRLETILSYAVTRRTTPEEDDLIWRYQQYLSSNHNALSKFVKCVRWEESNEAKRAMQIIRKWAPMSPSDALELLGPFYKNSELREYAVERLSEASDIDIELYLLQLVQALRYEATHETISALKEECSMDESLPPNTISVDESNSSEPEPEMKHTTLASFLINRASRNSLLSNYFYWYLKTECEQLNEQRTERELCAFMYTTVLEKFLETLRRGPPEYRARLAFLERQDIFLKNLLAVMSAVDKDTGNRKKKIEKLQQLLKEPNGVINAESLLPSEPLELPLDPSVKICGVIPSEASLFKSSLMPAKLTFRTVGAAPYVAIFKHGDDLRQDQLILQMVTLMDRILRQENLDLKLTPYRVLATSSRHGFVQFIDAVPIADVLNSDSTLQNFFRKHSPSENGPYGISHEVMDTYVKSCAGYCVITYLLGVGDRHLDNLLVTKDGKLFHIDFGYILGRDPKVMPPPMKLSKEMIEAFGGMGSEHYIDFRKQCYTVFLSLRRHANLILNLFSLMTDASVPDIALEPDKTVQKVQDKFRLDLDEEEAVRYIQTLIDMSASAVMAAIVERIHKFAQFWRN